MRKPLFNDSLTIANNEVFVNLPLRINFAGGWTDTPPYCNENGGVVLNAAVRVKGIKPIHASLTKLDKKVIVLNSKDLNSHLETTDISELQITGNPYDNFALQKAVLIACGVIPEKGGNLESILNRLGSGFEFNIAVDNIPKGSGLGTSSILSAACVKAVYEFFGIKHTNEDIYYSVLCVEQIMSTGGGWQDQIGGLYEGLKIITSNPGNQQNLSIETINLSEKTLNELNERLCLVYTGQRRLARNILRDVIGNYVSGKKESLVALEAIKKISLEMVDALRNDNVDEFATLLSKHLDYSKMIDSQSTNQLIDKIFESINDLVVGKMVCGAGGGGFLQIVLKKGVSMLGVNNRLKEIFPESEIAAWDVTIE